MNDVVAPIGLLLVLLATVVPFFLGEKAWAMKAYPWVDAAGAVLCFVARCFTPYRGMPLRLKRWYRIQFWGAAFLCMGAVFLFIEGQSLRDWLAFTLAGAAIQALCSIMIPIQASKASK